MDEFWMRILFVSLSPMLAGIVAGLVGFFILPIFGIYIGRNR